MRGMLLCARTSRLFRIWGCSKTSFGRDRRCCLGLLGIFCIRLLLGCGRRRRCESFGIEPGFFYSGGFLFLRWWRLGLDGLGRVGSRGRGVHEPEVRWAGIREDGMREVEMRESGAQVFGARRS